jgi:hypothetical protein
MKTRYQELAQESLRQKHSLQFGWEAEFSPHEAQGLLRDYAPLTELIGKSRWEALDAGRREGWLLERIERMGFGNKSCLLEKSPDAPAFLPLKAFRDDTRNIEIRSEEPSHDFFIIKNNLYALRERYGPGSLQLVVSAPAETFFVPGAAERLGWLNFFNELDILEKLVRGYGLYAAGYQGEIARSFQHPYLGPMNRRRRKHLRLYLSENAQGRMWGKEELSWVGYIEKSFKFVGSTAYRPDIAGPERVCFEVRDAHKNLGLLLERGARAAFYWLHPGGDFSRFAEIPAFDTETAFARLAPSVRERLAGIFPAWVAAFLQQYPGHAIMRQTYRNFSYPLRDWDPWLQALGGNSGEMLPFQDAYGRDLQSMEKAGDDKEARILAQRALGRFAAESPLYGLLRKKEEEIVAAILA